MSAAAADPAPPPAPTDSLAGPPQPPATAGAIGRRVVWLMVLRTVLISLVLGLTIWLGSLDEAAASAPAQLFLTGIVVVTYASTLVYALLLRGGADPERLIWPQLAGDLTITTALVYVTGGAQSAYTFFFALSVVGAGALRLRRGAIVVGAASVALMLAVGLAAWGQLLPLPTIPRVEPWQATIADLARQLGLNVGALVGVTVLAYIFGRELQETSASLASQRQVAADLYALNRDIVRSLTSGLITVDLEGRILALNQAAAEMLATATAQVTGRDVDALLPGLAARLAALAPEGTMRRSDLTLAAGDGRGPRVLGISVSPLRDPQDQVIGRVVNFQDLTELRTLEETMRRAERLATVGQLAAGIAHELRNPLASISGSVELLARTPAVADDDRALMAIVVREIERLDQLIRDLLEYASPRPRTLVQVDVAALLAEVVQVMRQDRATADVELRTELPDAPLVLTADPGQLRQVVWNLCRNAAEAAAAGPAGPGTVTVRARGDAIGVTIEVEDDGPGIASEHLPRVFDPFFTTKKRGTGLGLATSHAIVTEHGGTVDVRSEPGRGTRFVVRLPRAGARPPPPPT
ncbi:MAG: PAS domain-containing protein [Kofleriaceae bacterium]|nr:PAS domain-containing protein [Kofleriaceae bacterium]MCL4225709.1 PAS domain-containing protein [Myxococcales bacterium]